MRNSTEKFRQKYSSSPAKKLDQFDKFSQQTSIFASPQSTLSIKKQKSTPKIQTISHNFIRTQTFPLKKRRKIWDKQQQDPLSNQKVMEINEDLKRMKGLQISAVDSCRKDTKSQNQNNELLQQQEQQQFIQNMPKNSLFFCCNCYQYIFQIEKNRHFPDCKDQITKSLKDIDKIAVKRLQRLIELSQYTQTKPDQIRQLYYNYTNGQMEKLNDLKYIQKRFYQLKDIKSAFARIYHTFLKNIRYSGEKGFLICY